MHLNQSYSNHLFESIDTLKEAAATLTKHCITGSPQIKDSAKNILKKVLESQQRYVHISDMQSLLRLQRKSLKTGISVKELDIRRRSVKGRRIKRDLKTRENDTAYERKSDESSIIDTIRIQKRMKSKKRLWRNSELLLLQYPLAQDIIHK